MQTLGRVASFPQSRFWYHNPHKKSWTTRLQRPALSGSASPASKGLSVPIQNSFIQGSLGKRLFRI